VVPRTAGTIDRVSPGSASGPNTSDGPIRQTPSPDVYKATPASRLEAISRQLAEGISEEASELLAIRWSKGTNNTYQSAWKQWDGWCTERSVDPFSCSVKYFLEFLTGLFKRGLKYRTINTIRSAVSMTHDHNDGIPVGIHLLVSRIIHNLQPPQPRYMATWDVDIVLEYFKSMGPNNTLSLKQSSQASSYRL